jgi:aminoglycoside phosphotransferase (APT) family kinase protein
MFQTQQPTGRVFHGSDYRRMASLLRTARIGRDGLVKDDDALAVIDALATSVAEAFSADAAQDVDGQPFSVGYFVAGTRVTVDVPQDDAQEADDAEDAQEADDVDALLS